MDRGPADGVRSAASGARADTSASPPDGRPGAAWSRRSPTAPWPGREWAPGPPPGHAPAIVGSRRGSRRRTGGSAARGPGAACSVGRCAQVPHPGCRVRRATGGPGLPPVRGRTSHPRSPPRCIGDIRVVSGSAGVRVDDLGRGTGRSSSRQVRAGCVAGDTRPARPGIASGGAGVAEFVAELREQPEEFTPGCDV